MEEKGNTSQPVWADRLLGNLAIDRGRAFAQIFSSSEHIHLNSAKVRNEFIFPRFDMMSSSVPKVLILGHSFVKRLQFDLEATFDAGVFVWCWRSNRCDLHVVRRLALDVVILEVGTNDLLDVRPEVVGSSIEELVGLLLDVFSVSVVGVCHVIPRGVSFTNWEEFL